MTKILRLLLVSNFLCLLFLSFNANSESRLTNILNTGELRVGNLELHSKSFTSHINLTASKNSANYKSYEVFNHLGQLINDGKITTRNSNTLRINLEKLKTGNYLLKVKSKNQVKRFKIVKD